MSIKLAEEDVRARAYALWQARGGINGSPEDDWLNAEAQLRRELDAVSTPLEPLAVKAAETLEQDTVPPSKRMRPS